MPDNFLKRKHDIGIKPEGGGEWVGDDRTPAVSDRTSREESQEDSRRRGECRSSRAPVNPRPNKRAEAGIVRLSYR